MQFKASFYSRLENIVAVLVCIASLMLFGALWYLGLMPFGDFFLSVLVTMVITVLNVVMTWVAVHFFLPKAKKRRNKSR